MWRFYLAVAVVWLVLAPPFFTGGSCTAELGEENARLVRERSALRTPESAKDYFSARGAPVSLVNSEQCRASKPRFLDRCGSGPFVYAKVPVKNQICSFYRDSSIQVLIQYDDKGSVSRLSTDMAPFKSLPVPFTHAFIHWAR